MLERLGNRAALKSWGRLCRRHPFAWATVALLAAGTAVGGEGSPSSPPAPHPLGLFDTFGENAPKIVIRDKACRIDAPLYPNEEVVLSTVGIEQETGGSVEFHPLVSMLVDNTFPQAPGGQWLAVWNLGDKAPGALSRARAFIPGFVATKRTRKGELRDLERRLSDFDAYYNSDALKVPTPAYDLGRGFKRSWTKLAIASIKRGLQISNVAFLPQWLFRGYLLRRDDLQDRRFQQTYVGLTWYDDISSSTSDQEALSPGDLQELKFRMLANRSALGRWVKPEARQDFVHGYDAEVRDHLWGTSCTLASAANEFHLVYEEIQRYTPSHVPMALGGILYYDPAYAPAPGQDEWPTFNPFDLTYNPYKDEAVLRAAGGGKRVPLAVYVYQSHMPLKPIIVLDFFRPDNPRLRESAAYWRRLGSEALSSTSIGLLYNILQRAANFGASRKELTWFSNRDLALGIEELRLSVLSGLYFDPTVSDDVLDDLDKLSINPLVQPSRLQRARAELQYRVLIADGGKEALRIARLLRGAEMRKVTGKKTGLLDPTGYDVYSRHLREKHLLGVLRTYLDDPFAPTVSRSDAAAAVRELGSADHNLQEAVETLKELKLHIASRRGVRAAFDPLPDACGQEGLPSIAESYCGLSQALDASLGSLYAASGKGPEQLRTDLLQLAQEREEDRMKEQERFRKDQANQFKDMLKAQIQTLESFAQSDGDLTQVSPWYLARSFEFFDAVPAVIAENTEAAHAFAKREALVRQLLATAEKRLEAPPKAVAENDWLSGQRMHCLASIRLLRTDLQAALWNGAAPPPQRPTESGGIQ